MATDLQGAVDAQSLLAARTIEEKLESLHSLQALVRQQPAECGGPTLSVLMDILKDKEGASTEVHQEVRNDHQSNED